MPLFSQIYCEIIPKRHALSQANTELEMATTKLLAFQTKLMVSVMLLLYNVIIIIIIKSLSPVDTIFIIVSNEFPCLPFVVFLGSRWQLAEPNSSV